METLSVAFALFLLMDPLGNIPLFISILKNISPKRQKRIILRELLIALLVMIGFNFLGENLLDALDVSTYTVLIAGGIILFLISLKMIFPQPHAALPDLPKEKEPFIVPLAIPLVAGPAVLAAIILYAKKETSLVVPLLAIFIAWAASTLILLSSPWLSKILGPRGISACEKLMGLLLIMLSIQMLLSGVSEYIKTLSPHA